MAETDGGPTTYEGDGAPREQMRRDEEQAAAYEEGQEDGGGKRLVREIGRWDNESDDFVVERREIVHAILQVAHVPEEVFAHLCCWSHGCGWC